MDCDIDLIDATIAGLIAAMATGALRVRTKSGEDEKEVQYGSFNDMVARLNWLKRERARCLGCVGGSSTVGSFDRGRIERVTRSNGDYPGWDNN